MSLYHTTHAPAAYPKCKYAPNGGMVVVANETEERALGPGWSDNNPDPDAAAPADGPSVDAQMLEVEAENAAPGAKPKKGKGK